MKQTILQIPSMISRQYLVHGLNGYVLIDTGINSNYTQILKFLKKNNIPLGSVEMIIVTHADGDHFGCLSQLLSASPATVSAASQIEAQSIRLGVSSRPLKAKGSFQKVFLSAISPLFKVQPARIDRILETGEEFPFLGGLEVLDTKGHTPGHISLWSQTTRTLFCGDSIAIKGKSLRPSSGANTWDTELAINSFDNQLALKPDRIYAGHGVWQRE